MRGAIALLITLLFVISITFAIGLGLKHINEAKTSSKEEGFIIQTSFILDDVMKLLHNTKELDMIVKNNSVDMLNVFLSQSSFIPFESSGVRILLELSSARAKFNPNTLVDNNTTLHNDRIDDLKSFMRENNVEDVYVDMLLDSMLKIKPDMSYNTDIFNQKPYLFRDYIVSYKHLEEINDFYIKTFKDNSLNKIDFQKLFYFSKDRVNYKIDLNYATKDVWKLILGCDDIRAKELSENGGSYKNLDDLLLNEDEKIQLSHFKVSFFEPYIDVKVEIIQGNMSSKIAFEYDMKTKKGTNFSYEI